MKLTLKDFALCRGISTARNIFTWKKKCAVSQTREEKDTVTSVLFLLEKSLANTNCLLARLLACTFAGSKKHENTISLKIGSGGFSIESLVERRHDSWGSISLSGPKKHQNPTLSKMYVKCFPGASNSKTTAVQSENYLDVELVDILFPRSKLIWEISQWWEQGPELCFVNGKVIGFRRDSFSKLYINKKLYRLIKEPIYERDRAYRVLRRAWLVTST